MQINMNTFNTAASARSAFGQIYPHTARIPNNIPSVKARHPEDKSLRYIILTGQEHAAVSILNTKIRSTRRLLKDAGSGQSPFSQELEALKTAKANLVRHFYDISGPHAVKRSTASVPRKSFFRHTIMPMLASIKSRLTRTRKALQVATTEAV